MANPAKVILIGAGPGDPSLITVKAISWLSQADVVLYDFLAHPALLSYCKPGAKLISVGKRKGYHHKTQTQILSLIKRYAQKGEQVVRLKGGDPLLFGRGGEEMAYLKKQGIPFEVVPGVSSAWAVPAYAGISLTHRTLSRSVAIMTGSAHRTGGLEDIQIPLAETLVILMGITHLEELVERLLSETHFDEETPIALISKGSLADQLVVLDTLGTVVQTVQKDIQVPTPTLIVVGEVANMAAEFNWTSQLPLFGKRVVLLRSGELAKEWQQELSQQGAEVITLPMIESKSIPQNTKKLTAALFQKIDELVLTSPSGAKIFMEGLLSTGADARNLAAITITALGDKTAQILRGFGIQADRIAKSAHANGVLETLSKTNISKKTVLLPISADSHPTLRDGLAQLGAKVKVLHTYRSICPKLTHFPIQDGDIVLFTSGTTAKHFFSHPQYTGQEIIACCMGTQTAEVVADYQTQNVFIALKPTLDAMIDLIKKA